MPGGGSSPNVAKPAPKSEAQALTPHKLPFEIIGKHLGIFNKIFLSNVLNTKIIMYDKIFLCILGELFLET